MQQDNLEYAGSETMSERPRSYALIWSLVLAFVPTTIVVILLALLLFPDYPGEAWLGSIIWAAWVTMYGGIIVVVCLVAGIVAAIVHFLRTRSRWAWVGLGLNILLPLTIPGVILLPPYFGRDEEAWVAHNLHNAASEGNLKKVKKLVQKKSANINQMLDGYAPLHKAVAVGDLEMVEYLLENGADTNSGHLTPIHVLAASNWCLCDAQPCTCIKMLEVLIRNGANINRKCQFYTTDISTRASVHKTGQWTPLSIAIDVNNFTQIKHLVKHGADLTGKAEGVPALTTAVRLDRIETVEFLIENGADLNFGGKLEIPPLMAAANARNMPMAKYLLSAGADPNATDDHGRTLLHRAFNAIDCNEMLETIEFLLTIGMDIEAKDKKGHTPLHIAAKNRCQDTVKLLLTHGGNLNARTNDGQTPLHVAATFHTIESISVLLKAGADVNAKTHLGLTPLHKAVSYQISTTLGHIQREAIEILLQHGAETGARSDGQERETPIDLVRSWRVVDHERRLQQEQIIEFLEKYSESDL